MNKYKEQTFSNLGSFKATDGEIYALVRDKNNDAYQLFISDDVEEVSYTNWVIKNNYTILNGRYIVKIDLGYYEIENNLLHCFTAPALLLTRIVPYGNIKNNIQLIQQEQWRYFIYGKELSYHSWMSWIKDTEHWPLAAANILGEKE